MCGICSDLQEEVDNSDNFLLYRAPQLENGIFYLFTFLENVVLIHSAMFLRKKRGLISLRKLGILQSLV